MGLEHIGVQRLYELALNLEMFDEDDFRHLEWCKECLEVFKALSQYNRFKTHVSSGVVWEPEARIPSPARSRI
jgi:hypothetical protein